MSDITSTSPQITDKIHGAPAFRLAVFPLLLLYYEILLSSCENVSLYGIVNRFFSAALSGIVAALLCSCVRGAGLRKILTAAFFPFYALIFCLEYFLHLSYQTYMDFASVAAGAGDVVTGFSETLERIFIGGAPYILAFFLPAAALLIVSLKMRGEDVFTKKNAVVPIICAAVMLVCCPVSAALNRNGRDIFFLGEYSFNSATDTFGLLSSMKQSIFHNCLNAFGANNFVVVPVDTVTEFTQTDTEATVTEPSESTPLNADTEPDELKPIEYGFNVTEIDFDALSAAADDRSITELNDYVASLEPTCKNEYTGLFKGKNLILITAEAFSAQVVDKERTPALYRLANNGFTFTDYYQPAWGGSTSTGEFANLIGLIPTDGVKSMTDTIGCNMYFSAAKMLGNEGYETAAFHNGTSTYYDRCDTHPNLGYSSFTAMDTGLSDYVRQVWPASDRDMICGTVPQFYSRSPYCLYFMSVSGHCVYSRDMNAMSEKNKDAVADMDASETLKAYYACQQELENAMSGLLAYLEASGTADDTVIVISPDHYPYGLEKSTSWYNERDYLGELYGKYPENEFERDKTELIIWSGCLESGNRADITVDEPVYSVDILPTLLNLFGVEFDSRFLVGRDVFSDAEPLVIFSDYSWITKNGRYLTATGEFESSGSLDVSEDDYVEAVKAVVKNKMTYSAGVLENDYWNYVFG